MPVSPKTDKESYLSQYYFRAVEEIDKKFNCKEFYTENFSIDQNNHVTFKFSFFFSLNQFDHDKIIKDYKGVGWDSVVIADDGFQTTITFTCTLIS